MSACECTYVRHGHKRHESQRATSTQRCKMRMPAIRKPGKNHQDLGGRKNKQPNTCYQNPGSGMYEDGAETTAMQLHGTERD